MLSGLRRIQLGRLHGRCCHIHYSLQTYQRLPLLREFRIDNFILPCFTADFNSVIALCRNFSDFGVFGLQIPSDRRWHRSAALTSDGLLISSQAQPGRLMPMEKHALDRRIKSGQQCLAADRENFVFFVLLTGCGSMCGGSAIHDISSTHHYLQPQVVLQFAFAIQITSYWLIQIKTLNIKGNVFTIWYIIWYICIQAYFQVSNMNNSLLYREYFPSCYKQNRATILILRNAV